MHALQKADFFLAGGPLFLSAPWANLVVDTGSGLWYFGLVRSFVRSFVRSIALDQSLMPTVNEIAQYLGVSKSTVSLALNNRPGVSRDMRERVLRAAEMLKTLQAQGAAGAGEVSRRPPNNHVNTGPLSIVVLHPSILRSSQVFGELLQGIQAAASTYQVQLNLAVNARGLPGDHITRLYLDDPQLRPHGILIIGARIDEPLVDEAHQLGIPCVLVGREMANVGISTVGRDEETSAFEACDYLLDLGHRAIAFVGGDRTYRYTHSRIRGYRAALSARGIQVSDHWIALGDGTSATREILSHSPEVTALLYINDAFAMEGMSELQAAGLSIPAGMSVISFDDTEEARTFETPLTSVSFPRYQEGFWALRLLVEKVREPLLQRCHVVFQASLIRRASCAPPRYG